MSTLTPPSAGAAERVLETRARGDGPSAAYWTGFVIVVGALALSPLVLPEFWQRFATEILIWGLLAMSSDILIGYTGMVSFGHSAFFGLGMYGAAAALLMVRPPNLWLALAAGLAAAAVFSIPFTRNGLHWFVLAMVTVSYLLLRRITQSPFGMVLQSIRENEPRTRAIGYHVERYKNVAVMLSGLFAGLAGALYAVQNKFAAPDFVLFLISGETVIFNVMGGMGTLVGPVAGAAFFLLMKEVFSRVFYEYYLIPVGIIFTLMVIFLPQGLLGF